MSTPKKPKILFFDIETTPLAAYIWGLGKQVVRHPQLLAKYSRYGIICITYCWNDNKPAKSINWGYLSQNTAKVVKEFDKLVKKADHLIGKNNLRFDNKMINAARMWAELPGNPNWILKTDDLEQQMRRYFRLPSQSLDYISDQLGFGGKIKMEFQDWIDIIEKTDNGLCAYEKMIKYGKKDVEDTRALWNRLSEHFDPRFSVAKFQGNAIACRHCGSSYLNKRGFVTTRAGIYQEYRCMTCKRIAGRILVDNEGNTRGRGIL